MKEMNDKIRKIIFYLCVAVSFVAILIYNVLTPYMSDELIPFGLQTFGDVLKETCRLYMEWNGRSVVQTIMNTFMLVPKWFFNICNSLCFVYLMLLMYWNIDGRKKYDFVLLVLINLLVWIFGVDFGQTVLWLSGACNYLWGATIIMSMVTFYRYKIAYEEEIRYPRVLAVGMFFLGWLSGWCNENTSGGAFLLVIFCTGIYYYQRRRIQPWMWSGMAGMLVGLLCMVMAPGNAKRAAYIEETHSGVMAYVARFLKINNAIYQYFFVLFVIVTVVLVYMFIKGTKLCDMKWSLALIAVCIATSYALILTKSPMPRAYFGAGLFLIMACVQAIAYASKQETTLLTLKYAGAICLAVFMFFEYCESGADLMRIKREVDERDAYVEQQIEQGNYHLTVPMLRPEFDNRFTFVYPNDVTDDPESWGCQIYKMYYGVESLVGVSREEWTEY